MSPNEIADAVSRIRRHGKTHDDRTVFVVRQRHNYKLYLVGKAGNSAEWAEPRCEHRHPRKFSLPADAALYFFDLKDPPYCPDRYEIEEHLVLPDGTIDLVNRRTFIASQDMPHREPEVKNHVHIKPNPDVPRGQPRPPEEVPTQ